MKHKLTNYPSLIKVGRYNSEQLLAKQDKDELTKAQKESGFKFTITRLGNSKGDNYIDIYLVSNEDYFNNTEI